MIKASRSAGKEKLWMERAYVDKETGRVICCWQADNRQLITDIFKRAGVIFESVSEVEETTDKSFV